MSGGRFKKEIGSALRKTVRSFRPRELGYFALTSKIEMLIRDRLAFELHEQLWKKGFDIAREWPIEKTKKRVDIVIQKKGKPVCAIELKSMYTFDALKKNKLERFCGSLHKDEVRTAKAVRGCPVFSIMLITHPEGEGGDNLRKIIKYGKGIRSGLKKFGGNAGTLLSLAIQKIKEQMSQHSRFVDGSVISCGEVMGVKVEVQILSWLHRRV